MKARYFYVVVGVCFLLEMTAVHSEQTKVLLAHSLLTARQQNGAVCLAALKNWDAVKTPEMDEKSKADQHSLLILRKQRGIQSVSSLKIWDNAAVDQGETQKASAWARFCSFVDSFFSF